VHRKRCLDALLDGHPSDTLDFRTQGRVRAAAAAGLMALWFWLRHRISVSANGRLASPDYQAGAFP